jgi:hypothetical protein
MSGMRSNRSCNKTRRGGFTYIELITAMLSSTVLIAALAATVAISTKLFEVPPADQQELHDREIADRLAADLRYATKIDDTSTYEFGITKPDLVSGSPETANYEFYVDGMTRQVGSQPLTTLDPEPPGHSFSVDGYSAPTYTESPLINRFRSVSQAITSFTTNSLDIAVPAGCKPNDLLLLCISAKAPDLIDLSDGGWQLLQTVSRDGLDLHVYSQAYYAGLPTTTISVSPDASIAAAMVAIENVEMSSPVNWSAIANGYASSSNPSTHPTALETTGFNPRQLNVQIVAVDQNPWPQWTLGLASFTDATIAKSSPEDSSSSSSLGIAVRNGATPKLSTTPRVDHQASGDWVQVGLRLEAIP